MKIEFDWETWKLKDLTPQEFKTIREGLRLLANDKCCTWILPETAKKLLNQLDNIKDTRFMMDQIVAPFTNEQVEALNEFQKNPLPHPFTCAGENRKECPNDGILIATTDGWVCPCGRYKQYWAFSFMVDKEVLEKEKENLRNLGFNI